MFSSRLPRVLAANAVSRAVAARRAAGSILLDLTVTNPTAAGIPYPDGLLSSLGDPRGRRYTPDPRGLSETRAAIASMEYGHLSAAARADHLVLTASTSEAYALLFKLLCDPGDNVLVPQPSYPLFELLTRLEGVEPVPYPLEYQRAWSIARADLEAAIGPRTRAVLVVSPNNPTGSRLRQADREWLVAVCAARGLALISDEVFADYPLAVRADAASLAGEARVLTFVLGGLSKSAGLPQVKLAWLLASGPDELLADALARLDVISDTYLSVSTPVQAAAAELIAAARPVRRTIQARLERNLDTLRALVDAHPAASLLPPEGGWSAVLRVPATIPEDVLVLDLLESADVVVHPGYFFDFPHEAYLVLSLLTEPDVFRDGTGRVLAKAAAGT